eukprot:7356087-Heterocapsa_arctica.AAC.1
MTDLHGTRAGGNLIGNAPDPAGPDEEEEDLKAVARDAPSCAITDEVGDEEAELFKAIARTLKAYARMLMRD